MAAMNAAAATQGRARAGVSVNARLYEVHCSRRRPRSGLVGRLAGGEAIRSLDVVCAAADVAICRRLVPRVDRSALSALSLSLFLCLRPPARLKQSELLNPHFTIAPQG